MPEFVNSPCPESDYGSANTLAKKYDTTPSTIWRWSKSGRIPKPLKFGEGTTRWNMAAVHQALAKPVA